MAKDRDESVSLFAAAAVLKRTKPLLAEAGGVRKARDIECVHRMRVATRRLSAALELFADCFPRRHVRGWTKRLRRLRRALGEARDLDVHIVFLRRFLAESHSFLGGLAEKDFRPGIRRLLGRLRQRRANRQRKVVRALNRFEKRGVLEDMRRTLKSVQAGCRSQDVPGPAIRDRAGQAIRARLEELLALESCVERPESADEHHAMRIAAKRLRYALEVLQPLYGKPLARYIAAARDAQQTLGELHDCDVWVEFLDEFLKEEEAQAAAHPGAARRMARVQPGILFLQENRRRRRQRVFEDFAAFWDGTRTGRLWEQLLELVGPQPAEQRPAAAPLRLASA
jgi:CHAD domain-containing protein